MMIGGQNVQPMAPGTTTPHTNDQLEAIRRAQADEAFRQAQLDEQKREFDAQMNARSQALNGLTSRLSSFESGSSNSGASVGGGFVNTPVVPGAGNASGYQDTADTKAYARAKDNTGMALQASLKGLQATMAARGISGSGIEGGETEKLYQGGLTALANTDAAQSQTSAEHAFADAQAGKARNEQAREFDVGQGTDVSKFNAGLVADRQSRTLSSILQAYGSLY